MSSAESAIPRRRNGKQQACEPCRKSKQKCDHTMPVCYRCKRRRVASECKYGPSPIRVSTKRSTASGVPSSTEVVPRSDAAVDLRQSDGYEIFAAGSSYVQKCPNGYLGPTAYSAIFLEHQGKLDMGLLDPCKGYYKYTDDARICEHSHNLSVSHKIGCHTPTAAAIRLGAAILKAMPSQDICTRLVERYGVFEDVVSHKPTIKIVHQSWWDTYGSYLEEPQDEAQLSSVSEELCRNAWSFLGTELPRNQNEWVASCQGHNFRWEVLGVLLSMFGLAAISLPEWDSLFATQEGHRNDRRKFACSMRDLVEGCLLLCDHADNRSCETGKTSYLLWKRHGSLVSSVTALGLHREPKEDYPDTFIASQLRKRQFIGVFVTDKTMAAMSGRPPLLSRRYSTCQLPLDISEDELITEEPRLSEIKSKLDSHGWNTSGEVYPSAWARGLLLMNIIREEVLEITLDASNERSELMLEYIHPEQGSVNTKLQCSDLSKRCDAFYARLPQKIRYNPKQPILTTACIFPRQVGLHLIYLHCHFLLERLSVSRTKSSGQRLVDLAIEMLDDVLTLWAKRDWLLDFQWRFTLLFTMYGVPSAGVLCVELLKALKSPDSDRPVIPRAEVIRKLSIFVSCLEWARPPDETYTLCGHMHKIISHIMDQVLSNNVSLEHQSVAVNRETDVPLDPPIDDDTDWLEWLSNVDWTKGDWADFG